ncbi:hypothetical protein DV737_g1910, partial [Chaetothyriales sp. CBS 132003]
MSSPPNTSPRHNGQHLPHNAVVAAFPSQPDPRSYLLRPPPRPAQTPPGVTGPQPHTSSQQGAPSDESPASTVSSAAAPRPTVVHDMPRTSSIDSAISTMSHSSWAQKPAHDGREHTAAEIRNLIVTAGSAENLIQHLLRDKAHAAAQNAQLWKLVDKQRALLLGLNKDLDRLTKERDRYRKKAKELPPAVPTPAPLAPRHTRHDNTAANDAQLPFSGAVQAPQHQQANGTARSPVDDVAANERPAEADPSSLPPSDTTQPSLKLPTLPTLPTLPALATQMPGPSFNLTEATPLVETPPDSDSIGRGRRKTREEDDREREAALQLEREARSRSLKEKRSKDKLKGAPAADPTPGLPHTLAINPQPHPAPGQAAPEPLPGAMTALQPHTAPSQAPPEPLPGAMTALQSHKAADVYSSLAAPLRSPGLPASPRPVDRSPRNAAFPLSPRAPKQPLPPGVTPGTIPEQKAPEYTPFADPGREPGREPERAHVADSGVMGPCDTPPVNRSLVSPAYPDLLFPPNAIPSIQIRVASSRLKPSRFSVLGLKPQEETSVYNLSVFSRATHGELWRIEKIPAALPHLDQQLRQRVPNLPKVPDRRLFSGHAPATVDARRTAIEAYFDELLDTPVDEQSALLICKFLSTDVLEPEADASLKSGPGHATSASAQIDSQAHLAKSGFLTKKGKNFGGWKSRYFVLDSPELRYFEAQGGAHLGTIKLLGARIGRQTSDSASEQNDDDGQFRHAFLILEPKRKDSASYLRHVLCAESDAERDEWVSALLHYVDEKPPDSQAVLLRAADFGDQLADGSAKASSPTLGPSGSSSPTSSASPLVDLDAAAQRTPNYPPPPLSHAAAAQKPAKQQASNVPSQREQKIRHLFQFKHRGSQEHLNAQDPAQAQAHLHHATKSSKDIAFVRPVFGLTLAEAVQLCPPDGINVPLPAVVYRTIEYLRAKKAANEEGLFRLSGSNLVVRTLKDRFNTEGDVDLVNGHEYYDVHAVASLFKTYLRELPSTLLTRELHLEFLAVLELDDKQNKVNTFNTLVHRLPHVNYALLRAMSEYLLEVVQNADRNKMTVKNVGIVFSPTLNIPAPVFSMFLTEFDAIFDRRRSDDVRESLVSPPRRGNDDEIRSPRHQMFSDLPTTPFNSTSFAQNPHQQAQQQASLQPSSSASTGFAQNPHQQAQQQASLQPSPHRSNPAGTVTQKNTDPAAEFGMSQVQQPLSYETRHYVSIPQQLPPQQLIPPQPMYPPPVPEQPRQMQYRMLAPDAGNEKARRRESALFFG